MHYEATNL